MEKRLTMSLDDIIKSAKGKPSNRGSVAADKQTKVRAGRATSATLVFLAHKHCALEGFQAIGCSYWRTNRCSA